MRSMSSASIGVAAVAVAAGLWGTDALLRRPLAQSTEAATIVLGEHVILVLVLLPIVVAALPALWRAGPRYVAAAVVVGAGSSALATILFTEAFVQGDPVTPVVLQKVQPLIAVSLAAAILGERPRARFGLFLLGGLVGTWLMAFPSPFDVSLHGRAPALYALAAAALWALGTVLGRFLSRQLPLRARHGSALRVRASGRVRRGARARVPLTASLHDEAFIALLALVTGPRRRAPLLLRAAAHDGVGRVGRRAHLPSRGDRCRLPRLRRDADEHAARRRRAHEPRRPGFPPGPRSSPRSAHARRRRRAA